MSNIYDNDFVLWRGALYQVSMYHASGNFFCKKDGETFIIPGEELTKVKNLVFVTVMVSGNPDNISIYESYELVNAYVGADYEKAHDTAMKFEFASSYNKAGYIEYWADGKKIKVERIR